ncbi:hypothetical protein VE04_06318 [Pseudogymnoascus sp. 24MN13]|nr:hypothetical protein VE04_06318 [Pseudogymnoascus sp. 24MN13]
MPTPPPPTPGIQIPSAGGFASASGAAPFVLKYPHYGFEQRHLTGKWALEDTTEAINNLYNKLVGTDETGDTVEHAADHAAAEAVDHMNKKFEEMDTARASTGHTTDNYGMVRNP